VGKSLEVSPSGNHAHIGACTHYVSKTSICIFPGPKRKGFICAAVIHLTLQELPALLCRSHTKCSLTSHLHRGCRWHWLPKSVEEGWRSRCASLDRVLPGLHASITNQLYSLQCHKNDVAPLCSFSLTETQLICLPSNWFALLTCTDNPLPSISSASAATSMVWLRRCIPTSET